MTKQAAERDQRPPAQDSQPAPAQITLLYESRDGQLCLFQDAQGHLTAVRAEQLA